MIPQDIYNDARYVDIGDLPTGFSPYDFKELYARPFTVKELVLLYQGGDKTTTNIGRVIRAVNMAISCDVQQLTDGDFEYVLAWLRLFSYPAAPNQVHWTCKNQIVVEKEQHLNVKFDAENMSRTDLEIHNYEKIVCNTKNVEIVHNAEVVIDALDDDDEIIPYEDVDFPRVKTLAEYQEFVDKNPEQKYEATVARWIKAGNSLKEKMKLLENGSVSIQMYRHILECMKRYKHGISEKMVLKCRVCKNRIEYSAKPEITTFFAANSEQNILDMQYTLLSELKMQPDDDMPAKTLLYHYSSLAKDKQEEKERDNIRKAMRKK